MRLGTVVVLVTLLVGSGTARAHDLERTQVSLTFASDGTFVLDVANDPNWLLLRLEDFVGDYPAIPPAAPLAGPLSDRDRDARLRVLAPTFIDRVVLWVDHREIRATSAEYLPPRPRTAADDLVPLAICRLRGRMPVDATTLQWYYGLVVDPYPLIIHRADARPQPAETVLGSAWSRPLDLTGQFHESTRLEIARRYAAIGYGLIVSRSVEPIVFTLAIVLLGAGIWPTLAQLAAFSCACAAATAFVVHGGAVLPARAVEPLVALSVIGIAIDNLFAATVTRRRFASLAVFGALHGVQYAGALTAGESPAAHVFTGLASFDLGIVSGELTIATLAWLFVISYRHRTWYHQRLVVPASLAIAVAGIYWTLAGALG